MRVLILLACLTSVACSTPYRPPTDSGTVVPNPKRFTVEVKGRLEYRVSGLYLVSPNGDYKINTKSILGDKVTVRGQPIYDVKSGVVTLDAYEMVRE